MVVQKYGNKALTRINQMKKVLIVVEPKKQFRFGILSKLNKFRNFLEVKLQGSLLLKRLVKRHNVTIIPIEGVFDKSLVNNRKACLIKRNTWQDSTVCALQQAIELSRKWHLYGKLPELLQINGVNLGELVQHIIMRRFFFQFRDIDYANSLLKSLKPDIVYIQSGLSLLERTFYVCVHPGIECSFYEPQFYRALKKRLRLYLRDKSFKDTFASSPTLCSIDGVQDDESNYIILVDTPFINDFNTVLPVIQELMNQGISMCYIFGDMLILSRKIGNMKVVEVKNENIHKHNKGKSKELRKYYHSKLKKDRDFQAMFTYKGINFWDAVKDDIGLLFDREFITLVSNTGYFDRIIDTVNPDILVVGDDRAHRVRGHVLLAKQRGIPVLEIQHGIYLPTSPMDTPLSDKLAAGGDFYKRTYIKFGAHDNQVVVTGWPKFDTSVKLKESLTEKHKDEVDILFATQPIDIKLNLDTIEAIGSFIGDSTHVRLIVKPHPAENTKIYNQITKKYKNVILHKSSEDISSFVASSDILVTLTSTVAIEAALLDKPIICINTTNEKLMFVSSGIAIEVKKLDELMPAIRDVLYNKEVRKKLAKTRKKFVYEHAYIQDGKASKRVADLIFQMIEEARREKT